MPALSFRKDLEKEFEDILEGASRVVSYAAKAGYKAAVAETPSPWTFGSIIKPPTGTLYNAWRLQLYESSYVPIRHMQSGANDVPTFWFSLRKNNEFYLFNNMPYADYVERGINPWTNVPPRPMMATAKRVIEQELERGFARLK